MLLAFLSWWYGPGWKQVATSFGPRLKNVAELFSVGIIIPTLFAPWKRIVSDPGRGLEARLRAAVDNLFSRVIGFIVRCFVLIAAVVCLLLVAVLTALELIIWPLLPLAVPGSLIGALII